MSVSLFNVSLLKCVRRKVCNKIESLLYLVHLAQQKLYVKRYGPRVIHLIFQSIFLSGLAKKNISRCNMNLKLINLHSLKQ